MLNIGDKAPSVALLTQQEKVNLLLLPDDDGVLCILTAIILS